MSELSLANGVQLDKKQRRKTQRQISPDDREVLAALDQLKLDLEYVHRNLDTVTNPVLIDSYIYEIKSLHMKYQFYLRLCKEKGLTAEILT